tara:strand:- start:2427 stop:2801 length:375 start_codon:yes stop_codon:yes gene_type:complete
MNGKPKTYTVGYSELNAALDCLTQLAMTLEDMSSDIKHVVDACVKTLDPSIEDQMRDMQKNNPEGFSDLLEMAQEMLQQGDQALVAQAILNVADDNEDQAVIDGKVVDLAERRLQKNQSELYMD